MMPRKLGTMFLSSKVTQGKLSETELERLYIHMSYLNVRIEIQIFIYDHTYISIRTLTSMVLSIFVYICIYIYTHFLYIHVYIYIYICICVYVYSLEIFKYLYLQHDTKSMLAQSLAALNELLPSDQLPEIMIEARHNHGLSRCSQRLVLGCFVVGQNSVCGIHRAEIQH